MNERVSSAQPPTPSAGLFKPASPPQQQAASSPAPANGSPTTFHQWVPNRSASKDAVVPTPRLIQRHAPIGVTVLSNDHTKRAASTPASQVVAVAPATATPTHRAPVTPWFAKEAASNIQAASAETPSASLPTTPPTASPAVAPALSPPPAPVPSTPRAPSPPSKTVTVPAATPEDTRPASPKDSHNATPPSTAAASSQCRVSELRPHQRSLPFKLPESPPGKPGLGYCLACKTVHVGALTLATMPKMIAYSVSSYYDVCQRDYACPSCDTIPEELWIHPTGCGARRCGVCVKLATEEPCQGSDFFCAEPNKPWVQVTGHELHLHRAKLLALKFGCPFGSNGILHTCHELLNNKRDSDSEELHGLETKLLKNCAHDQNDTAVGSRSHTCKTTFTLPEHVEYPLTTCRDAEDLWQTLGQELFDHLQEEHGDEIKELCWKDNCGEVYTLQGRSRHHTKKCKGEFYQCVCGADVRRQQREMHDSTQCTQRIVQCDCGETYVAADKEKHLAKQPCRHCFTPLEHGQRAAHFKMITPPTRDTCRVEYARHCQFDPEWIDMLVQGCKNLHSASDDNESDAETATSKAGAKRTGSMRDEESAGTNCKESADAGMKTRQAKKQRGVKPMLTYEEKVALGQKIKELYGIQLDVNFHSPNGLQTILETLEEYNVPRDHPVLQRVQAFTDRSPARLQKLILNAVDPSAKKAV